jgi:hypothetical protein
MLKMVLDLRKIKAKISDQKTAGGAVLTDLRSRSMRMIKNRILILGVAFALFVISSSTPVYAYLDPGTSSYIIQVIVAGFLSGGYVVKIFWSKIKLFFTNLFKNKDILK